jgi:protein gp37
MHSATRSTVADATRIRWAGSTWNPMSGCIEVSPGCAHCYAKTFAERQRGSPAFPVGFDPVFKPWKLKDPIRWKEGRRVFVDSMSDLFFEGFTESQIDDVFEVMERADQHDYIVLTKRPERMRDYIRGRLRGWGLDRVPPHIWLGTTIENDRFTYRADVLREIPVDVRVISAEPLLTPLVHRCPDCQGDGYTVGSESYSEARHAPDCVGYCRNCPIEVQAEREVQIGCEACNGTGWTGLNLAGIGWLIVGGESGPGYRPMDHAWARDLRDRALSAGVPFFFKQSAAPRTEIGVELDGERWEQYPETRREDRGVDGQGSARRPASQDPAPAGPPGLGL